ncbi:response regulator transcription factor [Paraflavitalea sp. CAU 1676]|uniref:response regulator n=1 Tax=Paraflavitalea sp. CAU 1676 TaxID=3032598 RepID=UPI0023D9B8CF|nr:response regulator transcription factor [Paraflavitalea sp. CAU 1676]MDF2189113.1 response regulator transcription factor [Paraflavitalea sp. CAU 1676]
MALTIAITDDHLLVINGLKAMVNQLPDIELIFACVDGNSLLQELEHQQPDVLLLDIQLPDIPGTELCRRIKKQYPNINIIALTSHDDANYVRQILRNGASGYLLKNTDIPTIHKAILTAYEGGRFIDEQIQKNLVHEAITGQRLSNNDIPLTKREKEILTLIGQELNSQEIADKLFISLRTAENHRFNIAKKLGAKNTAALVKEAIRRGLI